MRINKETFRKATGLDHFYLGFSKTEIEELRQLTKLPQCHFSKVTSGKESWQGVYWYAADFSYFEMIESSYRGEKQLGIAVSANALPYTDVREIKKFYKGKEALESFLRKFGRSKKWFESIFKGPKLDTGIFVWAMHYFFCPIDNLPAAKPLPSVIQRFTDLEVIVAPHFLQQLEDNCYWAPFERKGSKKQFVLTFVNKDRSEFRVHCRVDKSVQSTQFVSVQGHATPFRRKLPKLESFALDYVGDNIVLKRKAKI